MTAEDVQRFLRSLDGGWVNWDETVDTFKAGDPGGTVTGIAVSWIASIRSLAMAHRLGCNLFITHEPTFYHHAVQASEIGRTGVVARKRRLIQRTGMTVLRCHDLWDQYPGAGIPDSWARALGFGDPLLSRGYFRLYDASGHTGAGLARHVAERVAAFGQRAVQLVGPPGAKISRLALGMGALTPFMHFVDELQADAAICTDDGFTYWRDGALAMDTRIPVVIVNHAVSEGAGMAGLAELLRGRFPSTSVHFLQNGCMFRLVGPKQASSLADAGPG